MPTRPPSLRAIAAFEAAARHENFGKAADELNLTHSAVSHAIRALEERFGEQLFARCGRTVTLTREGADLAKRVRASLCLLTDALEKRPGAERTRLSIGADPGVATRLLAPRLGTFQALHPQIDLELRCAATAATLSAGDIDVLIRSGAGPNLGMVTRLIAKERLYPVAAPHLSGARDLSAGPLVESREHSWHLWFDGRVAARRPVRPTLSVDTDLLAVEMAKLGLGVCLGPHLLVKDDLAAGALVRLSEADISARSGYHLDWDAASSRRDEIALFAAWIADIVTPALSARCGASSASAPLLGTERNAAYWQANRHPQAPLVRLGRGSWKS